MPKEIENPKMRQFFGDALAFIARDKKSVSIKAGTPEWTAWATYLMQRVGHLPWAMKAVEAGRAETATMPAQWPHWFDSLASTEVEGVRPYRSSPRRPDPSPAERSRVVAGFESLKRELASVSLSMSRPHPLPADRITHRSDARPLAASAELLRKLGLDEQGRAA